NAAFTRTAEGTVAQVIGTVEDITDRKQRELSLARLEMAIGSASDAIGISRESGEVSYINAAAEAIYGYKVEGVRRRGLSSLIPSAGTRAEIAGALQADQRWMGELDIRTKAGEKVSILLRVVALRDSLRRDLGTVAVATDLTERKQTEREMARHQEDLAHALR